jgi:hypothetical protein
MFFLKERTDRQTMKLKIGFFGAAVNAVVVIGILFFSAVTRGTPMFSIYLSAVPLLAVSAFVVYYFVVSSYVVKRAGIEKPVFFDSLVGMLAQLIIVTLGTVCYSLWNALSNVHGQGLGTFGWDIAAGVLMNLLWVFGMFMVHILIVGNIAGLVGWLVLKKTDPKSLTWR